MSCSTLNQQTVRMTVTAGSLPEGFCPASMQELFDAMIQRIIVTPNQVFTSFAQGSVEPTSNVGPWLKDCETWFVWDDATARYQPIAKGGFSFQQYFSASNTFVVPPFIYKIKVSAWGAGGGGDDPTGGASGGGGAGGGYASKILDVDPGENIVMMIGLGGVNGNPNGSPGLPTTVADGSGIFMTCNGGAGGDINNQSLGGTASGGDITIQGGPGGASFGGAANGGDAGGGGGAGGAIGLLAALRIGIAPGGGGAGGIAGTADPFAGRGAAGGVLIEW